MPDLTRIDNISALAVPDKRAELIRARLAIHYNVGLQTLFESAAAEHWDADRLAKALQWNFASLLAIDMDLDICRYLADEFEARDKTAMLLVSAQTGLAVAQVPEDAIYVPAPVAREGTEQLAVPLPRLRPEIEAAIIQRSYTAAAEPLVIAQLETRLGSTPLQRAEGDARLHMATRSGRKRLADRIERGLPELLRDHRGVVGRLLGICRVNEDVPEWCTCRISVRLPAHASILVADSFAMNFRHDAYQSAAEKIRAGWARGIAKALAGIAHQGRPREVRLRDELPPGLLVGSPNLAAMVRSRDVLAVEGVAETLVGGPIFLTLAEDAYALDSYETAACWCVDAFVTLDLHLDQKTLQPLVFTDLVESGLVVEVV